MPAGLGWVEAKPVDCNQHNKIVEAGLRQSKSERIDS